MENPEIISYIATGLVLLVVGYLLQFLEARPRLLWYTTPDFQFVIKGAQGNRFPVNTGGVFIQNVGRKKAENVEIVLSFQPETFQLQPPMSFDETKMKNGQFIIRLPSLGPKETVALQVLYYDKAPQLQQIRSDAGPAKHVPVWLQRKFPKWAQGVVAVLMLLGLAVLAYVVIKLAVAVWPIFFDGTSS